MNFVRVALGVLILLWANTAAAIGTAMTIQGTLDDAGLPANGIYDLSFQAKTPSGVNISAVVIVEDAPVNNGVFTVQVDLGSGTFNGNDRVIAIGVRPGASTGTFTALSPNVPVQPAPYAQLSSNSELADLALDVTDNAIDEIDINTDAVSFRNMADNSVGSDEIRINSVGSDEIASQAVGESEIGPNAVGNDEIQNDAVTLTKLDGAIYTSPANVNATIAANSCFQGDVPVLGGFNVGDFVIGMPNSTFPSNIIMSVGVVVSSNVVRLRFCNIGNTTQSLVNEQFRLISLR
jgi:hypothetical protein